MILTLCQLSYPAIEDGAIKENRTLDLRITGTLLYRLSYDGTGAAGGVRTHDSILKGDVLCQLSYDGMMKFFQIVEGQQKKPVGIRFLDGLLFIGCVKILLYASHELAERNLLCLKLQPRWTQ